MMSVELERTTPIRLGKIHLEALEAGPAKGPPVLLLHGFPETAWAWRKQIPALANAGFRCLAPDQRGYNRSSKPVEVSDYHLDTLAQDVIALADEKGFSKFRLVGHDWGGLVRNIHRRIDRKLSQVLVATRRIEVDAELVPCSSFTQTAH